MTAKSDFAQKLLCDLRLRKEQMAASQNSSYSTPIVGDACGNAGNIYKGSRQIKVLESIGSKLKNSKRRSHGGNTSLSIEESSKQIIPLGRGQNSKQIGDLSMALAFALQNGGEPAGISSVLSFLHQFGRRSLDNGKLERTSSFNMQQPSTSRFPTLNHLHIKEISKGAQKLNQILRACSNGLKFDNYSIEIGKELLKGAMDLEESLRMIVNLQETSEYMISPQRKNRIKLLEEDEDAEDNAIKIAEQKQLDQLRFSSDKCSRNSHGFQEIAKTKLEWKLLALTYPTEAPNFPGKESQIASNLVPHKGSDSYGPLSEFLESRNHSSSSQSRPERRRISNVIAKLMGLEELPHNIDSKMTKKESILKQQEMMGLKKTAHASMKNAISKMRDAENLASIASEKNVAQTNKIPLIQDTTHLLKDEKIQASQNAYFEEMVPDEKLHWKELERGNRINSMSGPKKATLTVEKQQSNISQFNQKERRNDNSKHKEQKAIERGETKEPVLKDELQQKSPQKHKRPEVVNILQEKIRCNESKLQTEKRNANKLFASNKEKAWEDHGLHQLHMLQKSEPQEEKKEEQSTKQKFPVRKQKHNEVESKSSSKPVQDARSLQNKQPPMNQVAPGKRTTEAIDVRTLKGLPNSRQQEDVVEDISSTNVKVDRKRSMNGNVNQNASPRELGSDTERVRGSIPPVMEENPVHVAATQRKVNSPKEHRSEAPQKIDEVTRRNGTLHNFARPLKHQISNLQEKKQRRHGKVNGSKGAEQVSASRSKEALACSIRSNKTEGGIQSLNGVQKLHSETKQVSNLYNSEGDECQSQKESHILTPNDSLGKRPEQEQRESFSTHPRGQSPAVSKDQELKSCKIVSSPLDGPNKESMEVSYISQQEHKKIPTSGTQELLTENETHLKQILMKSQLFLTTADALFKLHVPFGSLHVSDYDSKDEDIKLILDCGYEVMTRKGRRQELAGHPFVKISNTSERVSSLDDLVKQLYKEFERLKFYSRNGSEEFDAADYLNKMLEREIYNQDSELNSVWDIGWNEKMFTFLDKDDVIRDVERHVLNGLIDEIMNDLLHMDVSI